jgi:RNA polymerase sigma-70 factor (ECF subfamily)
MINTKFHYNVLGDMTISESECNESTKSVSVLSGELAVKIIQGNSNASNAFVLMNYRWLLFIIRKKFARSNNHEDIVQDTFMLVINKLKQGSVNNPQAILAYLRTTAINIGFEYLRKDKKFTSAVDQDYLEVIEDSKDDILSTIIWNDKVKYVKQVLSELKVQRDKDILTQFYFEDQSKVSICKKLDLSSEHFDRVLYRAKQRLKQLIAHKGDNNPNKPMQSVSTTKTKKSSFLSMFVLYLKHASFLCRFPSFLRKTPSFLRKTSSFLRRQESPSIYRILMNALTTYKTKLSSASPGESS